MAISYSGIVGYGKFNLPSVESWGTNNNILKDPPRSVFSRRKDKVGLNSTITQEIEMSADRVAEAIMAYPRGVNPMVGVSYNGQGNAGIHSGQQLLTRGQQAKYPYRVAMDGAFRPPVLAPVDLLPLSRMPRIITKVNCAVNNPNFQKKLSYGAEKNTYKNKIVNKSCVSKKIMNIKKPSEVIDRRHSNTRKNVIAQDVISKKCIPTNAERYNSGGVSKLKNNVLGEALNLNVRRKRQFAGQSSGQDVGKHIGKTLNIEANVPAASGHRKEQTQNLGTLNYEKYTVQPLNKSATAQISKMRKEQTQNMGQFDFSGKMSQPITVNAEATRKGYRRDSAAPTSVSNSCRAEIFKTGIENANIIERKEQDIPDYKRIKRMGGILVPNSGLYYNP